LCIVLCKRTELGQTETSIKTLCAFSGTNSASGTMERGPCRRLRDSVCDVLKGEVCQFCNTLSLSATYTSYIHRSVHWTGWLGSRVVSVLDSSAEGPGFKSLSGNSLRQTVHTRRSSVHQAAKIGNSPLKGCRGNCRPGGK